MPMLLLAMVWHARRRRRPSSRSRRWRTSVSARLQREREFLRDASHAIRTPVTIARGHVELIQGNLADRWRTTTAMSCCASWTGWTRCRSGSWRWPGWTPRSPQPRATRPRLLRRADRRQLDRHRRARLGSSRPGPRPGWARAGECRPRVARARRRRPGRERRALHGPGDRIELSCRRDGRVGTITVADSGAGIAPEDLPHVFERFWHRRPADGMPGSGLGLAMASAAAHAMGGTPRRASTLGEGASFDLSLPLVR